MPIAINGSGTVTGISAGGIPDGVIVQADLATGVAGTGPAFSAYGNGGVALSANTATKIALQNETFDTANCFDNSTNYRFTPNVAGYYEINGTIGTGTASSVGGYIAAVIYKNGSTYNAGSYNYTSTSFGMAASVSSVIYLNGSTDYVELYVYMGNGVTATTSNSFGGTAGAILQFSGSLVRAA